MQTTELTQVAQGTAGPRGRRMIALIVGVVLAAAIAIGAAEIRSSDSPAQTAPASVQLSIAPGHTQPAALIHRLTAQPNPGRDRNG